MEWLYRATPGSAPVKMFGWVSGSVGENMKMFGWVSGSVGEYMKISLKNKFKPN